MVHSWTCVWRSESQAMSCIGLQIWSLDLLLHEASCLWDYYKQSWLVKKVKVWLLLWSKSLVLSKSTLFSCVFSLSENNDNNQLIITVITEYHTSYTIFLVHSFFHSSMDHNNGFTRKAVKFLWSTIGRAFRSWSLLSITNSWPRSNDP